MHVFLRRGYRCQLGLIVWMLLVVPGAEAQVPVQATRTITQADVVSLQPGEIGRFDAATEQVLSARMAEGLGLDPATVAFQGIMKAPPQSMCQLQAADSTHAGSYLRLPEKKTPPSSARLHAAATIAVDYDADFMADADARGAFQRAVDTWSSVLSSSQSINVEAHWDSLRPGVLGSAGPAYIVSYSIGGSTRWYNIAMAEAVAKHDYNSGQPDIIARFSNQFSNWHTGTGVPDFFEYDLESVVLHELAHGLGFSSLTDYDDGAGAAECRGTAGDGCVQSDLYVHRFDALLEDLGGTALTSYADPSAALGSALRSDALFFNAPLSYAEHGDSRVEVYAPTTWNAGSSIAHLGEVFNGTASALMTYSLASGEVARTPGSITCALFRDMATSSFVDQAACASLALPVELVAFEARAEGRDVVLTWATASETNNAGFDVEMRRGAAGAYERVGVIAGAGTSAERIAYSHRVIDVLPGRYAFRLRQIDFDGTAAYGPVVEVDMETPTTFALSPVYPNPFNPSTSFMLAVATDQAVRIEIVDALGRRQAVLHDGLLQAHQTHTFTLDAGAWPSGLYLIRARGETFSATRRALLVK